jgi:hypothetical protein
MARYTKRVRVYNSQIQSLFLPGVENVHSEASQITRLVELDAMERAPVRSGHLRASHRRAVTPTGMYGVFGQVENTASYAGWVHDGTLDKEIVPKRGKYMRLRPGNGYPYPVARSSGVRGGTSVRWVGRFAKRVRGQAEQPWLLEAANAVLWRYGVQVTDLG